MNTLKNILKMINKINLAELLVCSEKKSNGKISRDKSVLSNECLLTDFSKVIEINMKKEIHLYIVCHDYRSKNIITVFIQVFD